MKFLPGIISVSLLLLLPLEIYSQNNMRIYTGSNVSDSKYYLRDLLTNKDSVFNYDNYILPSFGFELNYSVIKNISIQTGLGVSWLGAKKYITSIPAEFNVDMDLRLGYIKVPIGLRYKVTKNLSTSCQYIFNYNFRKNQSFYTQSQNGEIITVYKPYRHEAGAILYYRFNNFDISAGYIFGLSPIWNTKNLNPLHIARVEINSVCILIGYIISEKPHKSGPISY